MQKKLTCWHCKKSIITNKINFRLSCDACFQDQHVCLNCKHYAPSKPNCCEIFTTENVKDKEKRNFCDDFSVKEQTENSEKKLDKIKKLFGDDLPEKKSFDDLFN